MADIRTKEITKSIENWKKVIEAAKAAGQVGKE